MSRNVLFIVQVMNNNLTKSWNTFYQSVCSITLFLDDQRVSSGTGFRVGEYIATNAHVIDLSESKFNKVKLRFVNNDGFSTFLEKTYTSTDFRNLIEDCSDPDKWDFLILRIDCNCIKSIPSLNLDNSDDLIIGNAICLLGFQFEQQNLSIHGGIISSLFKKKEVDYIQIDASVNQGNSGGPLIDVDTGNVIGIVTRKATGFTKLFDKVIESFDDNIQYLKQYNNVMTISGFNPVQPLIWNQNQMKILSKEIKRSANVGIGYAYKIREIRESITGLQSST